MEIDSNDREALDVRALYPEIRRPRFQVINEGVEPTHLFCGGAPLPWLPGINQDQYAMLSGCVLHVLAHELLLERSRQVGERPAIGDLYLDADRTEATGPYA
ncbi:hypothetical protein WME88_37745 [Sorangium sp. So ce216]